MTVVTLADDVSGYLRGAQRCASPSALASYTVDHLRDATAAAWGECVSSSHGDPLQVLASTDAELTRELMRARVATHEPPDPELNVGRTVAIADLTVSSPWPSFAARASRSTSVRSAVLTYFSTDGGGGVLTVIDPRPSHFDALAQTRVRLVADLFAVLLDRLQGARRAADLERAVTSGRRIGAACGMLAARHDIGVDEAWRVLRETSQQSHRKLRDLAERVIAGDDLPW